MELQWYNDICWDGIGRSPIFEFPSKKAITWVQTSRNVDISGNSNGHISVLHETTVMWLVILLVLHVLCMLMWPWPNPRSRSHGFSTSEGWWSRACWQRWPSAALRGFLLLLMIVDHVFCEMTACTVLCLLSDVLMNDCLWRCLETPVYIKLPFKHWGLRCCQHSQRTPAALCQRPAACQVALSFSSTSTTALMINLPVPLPWWSIYQYHCLDDQSTSTTALMVNLPVPLPWWSIYQYHCLDGHAVSSVFLCYILNVSCRTGCKNNAT